MDLPDWLDVSRETAERLRLLLEQVSRWTPAVNLVSPTSLTDGWRRHILDSAQIFQLADRPIGHWVDLGSGGGFPGLVVAIMAQDKAPDLQITLVESDRRKASFLTQAVRTLNLTCTVLAERAESLPPLHADILSARAFAPLDTLCRHASRHLKTTGLALFPKGESHLQEVAKARQDWQFDLTTIPSRTDPRSAILLLRTIHHA